MSRINVDGNLHALSQYERRMDEIDQVNEQYEAESKEYAFEAIVTGDVLFDYVAELPTSVYEEMAVALYKCNEDKEPDYCEFGRVFIKRLTKDIVESDHFDGIAEQWVEDQQGL